MKLLIPLMICLFVLNFSINAQDKFQNKTIIAVNVVKEPEVITYNLNFVIRNDLNLKHEYILKSLLKERNDLRKGVSIPKYAVLVFSYFRNPGENPENSQIIITDYYYIDLLDNKTVLATLLKIDKQKKSFGVKAPKMSSDRN